MHNPAPPKNLTCCLLLRAISQASDLFFKLLAQSSCFFCCMSFFVQLPIQGLYLCCKATDVSLCICEWASAENYAQQHIHAPVLGTPHAQQRAQMRGRRTLRTSTLGAAKPVSDRTRIICGLFLPLACQQYNSNPLAHASTLTHQCFGLFKLLHQSLLP